MMYRGFGGTAFEPVEESRDREITLGPIMLAGLVLALLALCGMCFIGGYAVGRTAQPVPLLATASNVPSAAQPLSGQSKPAATKAVIDAPPAASPRPPRPRPRTPGDRSNRRRAGSGPSGLARAAGTRANRSRLRARYNPRFLRRAPGWCRSPPSPMKRTPMC